MISRRKIILCSAMVPFAATAWAKPCAATRVLLVCPAGSVKSAIAREELKRMAELRSVPVEVESRGIHPEDHISPLLAQRLSRDGIDPLAQPLRRFAPEDAKQADIVIAFDEAAYAPRLENARACHVASWHSQYDDAKSDTWKFVPPVTRAFPASVLMLGTAI